MELGQSKYSICQLDNSIYKIGSPNEINDYYLSWFWKQRNQLKIIFYHIK